MVPTGSISSRGLTACSGVDLRTHSNQLLWFKSIKRCKDLSNEGFERLQPIPVSCDHDDGDRQGIEILLELQVLVGGDQHVEVSRGESKQLTVLEAGPASLTAGSHQVADEQAAERPRKRFIEQDAQGS